MEFDPFGICGTWQKTFLELDLFRICGTLQKIIKAKFNRLCLALCRVDWKYKSFVMNRFVLMSFLFFIFNCMFSPSPIPFPHTQNLSEINIKCQKIDLNWIDMPQIILFGSGLVSLFWFILIHLVNQVNFITFNTNLNVYKKIWILHWILPLCGFSCYYFCKGCF